MKAALYTYLKNANIVGSQVYPDYLPDSVEYPAAIFTLSNVSPLMTFDGPEAQQRGTLEITVFSMSHTEAETKAQAFVTLLDGFKSSLGGYSTYIYLEDVIDTAQPFGSGTDDWLYSMELNFRIRWE